MQIWKEKTPQPGSTLNLPGRPLHVQDGFVWFESTGTATKVMTVGTGWDLPNPGRYIGTWADMPFVWHLYDGVV